MTNSVLQERLPERIIIGILVGILVILIVCLVAYAKKNNKHKMWFKPIGLKGSLYDANRFNIWNSDYVIWAALSGLFLVWWLGAYWIVNLIQLGQYNQAIQESLEHGGIIFEWDPEKRIANGDYGGFNALYADRTPLKPGQESLMPFVMKQTNVTYALYNLLNKTANGTNLVNETLPFFDWPDPNDPQLLWLATFEGNLSPTVESSSAMPYINNFLSWLRPVNRDFAYGIMLQWLHSFTFSNIFLTPLCQFLSMAFPLSIILSYRRDYASFFAPWAFLGGTITVYGGVVADSSIHVTPQFIFFDQQLFFGYHVFLLVVGIAWLVYSNRFSLSRIGLTFALITGYVIWVLITSYSLGIKYYTTGLNELDYGWSGSYEIIPIILKNTNIKFPGNAAMMITVFVIIVVITLSIKNLIHYKYWKKQNPEYNESFCNDVRWAAIIIGTWLKPTKAIEHK